MSRWRKGIIFDCKKKRRGTENIIAIENEKNSLEKKMEFSVNKLNCEVGIYFVSQADVFPFFIEAATKPERSRRSTRWLAVIHLHSWADLYDPSRLPWLFDTLVAFTQSKFPPCAFRSKKNKNKLGPRQKERIFCPIKPKTKLVDATATV